jgi:lipopolysaccharide/colanic/teichoic acid biosynthesis glycosyltransferase
VGLKCVLVRVEFSRFPLPKSEKDYIFLINADEESRVHATLADRTDASEVIVSASLSQNLEQDIVEQEILEIRRLFHEASAVVVSKDAFGSDRIAEVVCEAHLRGIEVMDFEAALLVLDPSVPADSAELIRAVALRGLHQSSMLQSYAGIKNLLEPFLASLLLLILSPLFLVVALMVKLTSPGPIFYRQTRLGYRRQLFDILKFRSMRIDAEKDGPVWASASKSDARLTPIGGFLRATHLDELPQIWNVIAGEVSFIGPRPERPVFCQELELKIPLFKLRTLVKPGITGWAQIRAGYANSVSDSKRKLEFDLYYVLKHSPWLDLRILVDTVALLFMGGSEGRKRQRVFATAPSQRAVLPGLRRRASVVQVETMQVREKAELTSAEIS